jgi:hypothetical protein
VGNYPGMPQVPTSTIRRRLLSRFCCTGLGRLTQWDDVSEAVAPSGYFPLGDELQKHFLGTLVSSPAFDHQDADVFLQFHKGCNGGRYRLRLLASIGMVFDLRLLKADVEYDASRLDEEMVEMGEYICFLRRLKNKSGVLQHLADLAHSIGGDYGRYENFLYCKKDDKPVVGELFSNLTFYMLLYFIDSEQARKQVPSEIYNDLHRNIQAIIKEHPDAKDARGYPTAYSAFAFYMFAKAISGGWPPWNQKRFHTSEWLNSLAAKGVG